VGPEINGAQESDEGRHARSLTPVR
jgi:hypothetical protein